MVDRDEINQTIRDRVVPSLRDRGFRGSFPHFRRVVDQSLHLLSFQFNKHGGSFVVEIATGPAGDFTTYWGQIIPESKMNATYVNERLRLGASDESSDHWFDFTGRPNGCSLCVDELLELIDSQAEPWWKAQCPPT